MMKYLIFIVVIINAFILDLCTAQIEAHISTPSQNDTLFFEAYAEGSYSLDSVNKLSILAHSVYDNPTNARDCYTLSNFEILKKRIAKLKPLQQQFKIQGILIEYKSLQKMGVSNRAIAYWIENPRVSITCDDEYTCPNATMGHGQLSGHIRFSLLDTKLHTIINTINYYYPDDERLENGAIKTKINLINEVPYSSPNFDATIIGPIAYYSIGGNSNAEGLTEVLHLLDYNGDGNALEFALYNNWGSCLGLQSTLFGYSKLKDRLIQYPVELENQHYKADSSFINQDSTLEYWDGYLFRKRFKKFKLHFEMDYRSHGGSLLIYNLYYDALEEKFKGIVKSYSDE